MSEEVKDMNSGIAGKQTGKYFLILKQNTKLNAAKPDRDVSISKVLNLY